MTLPDNPIARALWGAPKPHYAKGDTTAATNRIAQIRFTEAQKRILALKVDRELITPIEEQLARLKPRFRAVIEGVLAKPSQPATPGDRPATRVPIPALVKVEDRFLHTLATTPAAMAIVALCGCRWPIGDPSSNVFHFCNRKRAAHFYCEAHERESRK